MYHASETKIRAQTRIRRERVLPKPGEILVSPGDQVEATQVVARADLLGQLTALPVARWLDIPTSKLGKSLHVEPGDTVQRGSVVGKTGGILGRSVRSPIDGIVTANVAGMLLIEGQTAPFELQGYIPGTVLEVTDDRRVVIETMGALVQGVWGLGGESVGTLKVMTSVPEEVLSADAVDLSCHGAIVVAGVIGDQELLKQAENVEAHGVVTGGLCADSLPIVEQLPFPVVVTDGIGNVPMASPIFDLLKENDGEQASVNGYVEPRRGKQRPEVIIPKSGTVSQDAERTQDTRLAAGTRVRVVRAPHAGSVGVIVNLPRYARHIDTGARVRVAEVDIGYNEPISVPLVNLDVLL